MVERLFNSQNSCVLADRGRREGIGGILSILKISVADPGCFSWSFYIPDPGSEFISSRTPDPGSASKNLSILTQKMVSKISEIWSGWSSRIRIPDPEWVIPTIRTYLTDRPETDWSNLQHLASFCRPRVLDVTTYERVGWKDPCHSHPFVPGVGPKRVNLEVCVLQWFVYR